MNIKELAEQAGIDEYEFGYMDVYKHELDKFAALVAAHEREECAKIADKNADRCNKDSMAYMLLSSNADAIRARSKA